MPQFRLSNLFTTPDASAATPGMTKSEKTGRITLVGAGPGDPNYITLRGVECLAAADVVLYDYLVNPAILRHVPTHVPQICLGQHGRSRIWSQEEVNAELIQKAQEGLHVVRLKCGDPTIFARLAEEMEAILASGVSFEIVPGITAAQAAGSCAGIPLTHRDFASTVALITGHEDVNKRQPPLDYSALAKFPGTLVFYMGVTTVSDWSKALIVAGKSPTTPVAVVRRCSFPDQQIIHCTLGTVAERITTPEKLRPPVIFVVGEVAKLSSQYSWFEKRPLFGRRILVTRPCGQAQALSQPLLELGADVLYQPAIQITPPTDWNEVDAVLARLKDFAWMVFASANGVEHFFARLLATGRDVRSLGHIKLAAIGPGTAEALQHYHLHADLLPAHEFRAEALAACLSPLVAGQHCLLIRASRGREVLAEQLTVAGARVTQVVAYFSEDLPSPAPSIVEQLEQNRIDWITVTSSAIAKSLVSMFGELLRHAKLASISPITSDTLRTLGFPPDAEASSYTMPGVVQAIVHYEHVHFEQMSTKNSLEKME
jgi:uroporphyrinogen III methyltransferase/synthase